MQTSVDELESAKKPDAALTSLPAGLPPAQAVPAVASKGVSVPSPACANSSNTTAAADDAVASEAQTATTAAASVPLRPVPSAPTPVAPESQGTPGSTVMSRTFASSRLAHAGLPAGIRVVDLDFLRQTVTGPPGPLRHHDTSKPQEPTPRRIYTPEPQGPVISSQRHRGYGGRGGKNPKGSS